MGSLIQTESTSLWQHAATPPKEVARGADTTTSSGARMLKGALAAVFVWFGLLKLLGVSPMRDTILAVVPLVKNVPAAYTALALFEVGVGVGILLPRAAGVAAALMLGHLTLASLAVLVSPIAWEPVFPCLSLIGEFVAKNLVLAAAALFIVRSESASRRAR